MGFGQTLREAREAKGYTVAQLAEITHIMSRTIEGFEAEDFSSIAAPIYGRGFVKICCQALGLDPKPMVDEFMAIYNGEEPPVAVQLEVLTPPQPEKAPEPMPEPPKPEPSRFAPPQPQDDDRGTPFPMPAIPWRLVILVLGGIAVIWALIAGCCAIFRALGSESGDPAGKAPAVTVETNAKTTAPDAAARMPRTPKPVKPLYID